MSKSALLTGASAPRPLAGTGDLFGLKGRLITTAIAQTGYAHDPDTFLNYYAAHQEVIDPYLEQIDLGRAAQHPSTRPYKQAVGVGVGIGLLAGLGVGYYLWNERDQQ